MSKSALSPIEDRIKQEIQKRFPNPAFIIGVSGGPDSMAMLYMFSRLDIEGTAVHVNYMKRGEESDKDQELVEQMAAEWGFECHSIQLDSEEAGNVNFQQWARECRYRIFRDLKEEYEADAIVTAHHMDDQIETILQKLFRGAGIESWQAMEIWNGELFRPLLEIARSEIENYLEEHEVPYRVDRSNLRSEFARNFLRNEWIPELEKHFPGWEQNILRLSEQGKVFSQAMEYIKERIVDKQDRIDREALLDLALELQKAFILYLLKRMEPGIEVSRSALGEMDELAALQTGKSIQLTGNFYLMRDRDRFKIVFENTEALTLVRLEKDSLSDNPFYFNDLKFEVRSVDDPDYGQALYLDSSKIGWPLKLRRWKHGDLFQPFGMVGHQNVSDHLTNRKTSAFEKEKALVIETFEETICAVIFPPIEKKVPPGTISEIARCDSDTEQCLVIEWKD